MKLILTQKEAIRLQNIMESAERGSTEELSALVKDNKIIQFKVCPIKKEVEVTVDENYMVDFLDVYDRFVGLFVSQVKTLAHTAELFAAEANKVVAKYTEDLPGNKEE